MAEAPAFSGFIPTIKDLAMRLKPRRRQAKIAIIRHPRIKARYGNHFLNWLKENDRELFESCVFFRLPQPIFLPKSLKCAVFWLQDPFNEKFPNWSSWMHKMEKKMEEKEVSLINPPSRTSISVKSVCLPIIRECGIRTAKTFEIQDPKMFIPENEGMPYPFFIRNNLGHGGPMHLVHNEVEFKQVDWNKFKTPVAVEYIDVINKDKIFRKYRVFVVGNEVIPRHLILSSKWSSHVRNRIQNDQQRQEEDEFLKQPIKEKELFIKLKTKLKLDFVAFDYSYDKNQELVIWEPNPLPGVRGVINKPGIRPLLIEPVHQVYRAIQNEWRMRAGMAE